jgi:hypothetical protein
LVKYSKIPNILLFWNQTHKFIHLFTSFVMFSLTTFLENLEFFEFVLESEVYLDNSFVYELNKLERTRQLINGHNYQSILLREKIIILLFVTLAL